MLRRLQKRNIYRAAGLPKEIIELMKEPSERSEKVKELFKGFVVTTTDTLSLDKALKIATELRGFPKDKLIEVAETRVLPDSMYDFHSEISFCFRFGALIVIAMFLFAYF